MAKKLITSTSFSAPHHNHHHHHLGEESSQLLVLHPHLSRSPLFSSEGGYPVSTLPSACNMSTNHLPLELPAPSAWKLPVEQLAGSFVPQRHQHHHQQQLLHEGNYVTELLFEKHLTPSDVGKLNRLVIPKQHAERYFPLDGDCGEKGLLLSFEDESGKTWQFRYSYWTSSQSYVLTKGWSRFVKDKGLDAGDVVLFERRRSDGHRLYIGWKRRGELARLQNDRGTHTGAARWNPVYDAPAAPPPTQHNLPTPAAPYAYSAVVEQQQDTLIDAGEHAVRKATRAPPAAGTGSRRLRLFGVNLECGPEPEPEPLIPGSNSGSSRPAGRRNGGSNSYQ